MSRSFFVGFVMLSYHASSVVSSAFEMLLRK